MYPPAMCYEIYRAERGLVHTDAERRAVDERAGEMAATLAGQARALAALLTLARPRRAWGRWNILSRNVTRPIPSRPAHSGGAGAVTISTHKTGH
jgi:hypothetical protein